MTSKEFDEIEERILNARTWGLGLAFAGIIVIVVGGSVGRALGWW